MSHTLFLITLRCQKNAEQDFKTHLVKLSTMVISFRDFTVSFPFAVHLHYENRATREEDSSEIRDQERRINEIDVIFLGLEYKED